MNRCHWNQDGEDSDVWATSCGHYFTIGDGTPEANDFKFCVYCGGALREEPYHDADCTCHARPVRQDDISPPEVTRNPNCPVHGRDWDAVRDAAIDDKLTEGK
jgi:hypothetical protein